jgi:SAM-dependent methyltransferase
LSNRYRDGTYVRDNPSWHDEDGLAKSRAVIGILGSDAARLSSVVDVGCGTGRVLSEVAAACPKARCEGWDIASEAIDRAGAFARPGLRFVCGDFLEQSGPPVDLVLCLDTFEHVIDVDTFLSGLLSRAHGFVFRIPLDLSAWDIMRSHRLVGVRHTLGHHHVYNRAMALDLLKSQGFRVVREDYHRIEPDSPTRRGRAMGRLRRGLFRVRSHAAVDALGGYSLMVYAESS